MLVVTALFTALIAPYFIDWTAHKQQFEQQASLVFGHPVKVGGRANLRILPLPSVSFGGLQVGENADGSPLLSIEQFSAKLELIPFLSGEVRVVDMTLDSPIVNLQVNENGSVEWTNRKNTLVDPKQVTLNKVNIRDATINITGLAGGRNFKGDAINGEMSAKSLYGPWVFEARGNVEGIDTAFQISTGRLQDAGNIRLKLSAQRADQPYKILLDGPIGIENEVLAWKGKFKFSPILKSDESAANLFSSNKQALPVRTNGNFELTPAAILITQFRSEIGDKTDPFVLTGNGGANLKEAVYFRFQVDGRQINLDRVAQMRGEKTDEIAEQNLDDRIRIVREVLEQIPVPNIKGEIDFEVPAIVAGDSIVREVSALISPKGNGWEIKKLHAKLPGSSTIEAKGRLGLKEDFGFSGHLVLASKQPSGFASWAVGKVDPAIRRLNSGGLEADVSISQGQTSFENMTLLLGNNKLTGKMQRIGFSGSKTKNGDKKRAAIIATLSGQEIRLDDLKAILALTGNDASTNFSEHDLDVSLKAGQLDAYDIKAKGVDVQFQLNSGELSIGKLNAESFFGSKITSIGQIRNLLSRPRGNIKFNLITDNGAPLISFLERKLGKNAILSALIKQPIYTENTKLDIEIDASPSQEGSRGRALVNGEIGGSSVDIQLGFDAKINEINSAKLDLTLNLANADPKTLLAQTSLLEPINDVIAAQLREGILGPLKLTVESVGSFDAGLSTLFSASTPDASVTANGLFAVNNEVGGINDKLAVFKELDVTLGFEDVSPYLLEYGYDISNSILEESEKIPFSANVHFEHGKNEEGKERIKLSKIAGSIAGNSIAGGLDISTGVSGRPMIEGALALDVLSIPKIANFAFGNNGVIGDLGLNSLSDGGWSQAGFGTSLLEGKDAKLTIDASKITTGTKFSANNGRVLLVVRDGDIELKNIITQSMGGTITGNLALQNSQGTGVIKAQFSADGIDSELLLKDFSAPGFLNGKLQINGTIESNGKSPKAIISGMSGGGIATLEGGKLKGINVEGLKSVLDASSIKDFEIDAVNVDPISIDAFLNGEQIIERETAAYSISRGMVQIRNLLREGEGWETALSGKISLLDAQVLANVKLSVDAGKDRVSGASPEIVATWRGPIDGLVRSIDSQALQGFLSVRALEAEERRVELLQAAILEKNRLRFEILKTNTRFSHNERVRARAEELERQRLEKQRLEAEQLEAEQLEVERLEKERLETERLETERLEKLRLEAERLEAERKEAERKEAERLEAKRLEIERLAVAKEKTAKEKAAKEKAAKEKIKLEALKLKKKAAEQLELKRSEEEALKIIKKNALKSAETIAIDKPQIAVPRELDLDAFNKRAAEALKLQN